MAIIGTHTRAFCVMPGCGAKGLRMGWVRSCGAHLMLDMMPARPWLLADRQPTSPLDCTLTTVGGADVESAPQLEHEAS